MSDLLVRTVCQHGHTAHHVIPGKPEDCTESREIVLRQVANFTLAPHDEVKVIEFTEPAVYVLVEEACAHDWVDATNEIIRSGKWCRKCNAVGA